MKKKILFSIILLLSLNVKAQIVNDSAIEKSMDLINKKKAPGVYIEEINIGPNPVVEVETAIPAFIGYTQIAINDDSTSLILKPMKISSMLQFEHYFGFPASDKITISVIDNKLKGYMVDSFANPEIKYLLYYCVKHYFSNGGGPCYIVSAGTYPKTIFKDINKKFSGRPVNKSGLINALDEVAKLDEPTLLVIPDAVNLSVIDYQTIVRSELNQCLTLGDRFAIFDLFQGNLSFNSIDLNTNRGYFGQIGLKFGAAYYPFLKTTYNYYVDENETNVSVSYLNNTKNLGAIKLNDEKLYNFIKTELKKHYVILPPSGAVAGVYAKTDRERGVWKAPANVQIADAIEPVIKLNQSQQSDLNIDPSVGISINSIVLFTGKGTMVWGARTLAGNDNEWRYVPVRRFFNMVEESVKKSTEWVVFEPNDVNTWTKVRSMIENYLTQKWREGALAGSKPVEAFFVKCGLGQTMTNLDIQEGRLNIEIGMAVVRPAEFIILKFSHKMN
jgi:uncharacterized protein